MERKPRELRIVQNLVKDNFVVMDIDKLEQSNAWSKSVSRSISALFDGTKNKLSEPK